MTIDEAIDTIRTATAQVEWDYPIDYAAAFSMAVEALKKVKQLEEGVEPVEEKEDDGAFGLLKCGECGRYFLFREQKYCISCGTKVKMNGR